MSTEGIYYVDVLLPLHIPNCYTYRVPQEYNGQVHPGQRVVVQFGHQRIYSALVRRIHTQQPEWKSKYIMAILDTAPIVTELQMEFWEWMARYYMCYPGDVMAMALPAGMKLASESAVAIHPDFDGELSALSKQERQVVQLLSDHPVMRVADIGRALGVQKVMPLMRTMIENSIIVMDEELRQRFVPKTSTYVRFSDAYSTEEEQRQLFDDLDHKRRTKQIDLLMQLLQLSHTGTEAVAKRLLPQGSALGTLIKNGVLTTEEHIESRIENYRDTDLLSPADIVLNDEQQAAFRQLSSPHAPHSTFLLHGVTSSGKTEVYIKLIDQVVRQGRQALLLLPEIALTTQVINRLKRYFGDKVGVYHSRFSASQRVEVWNRTLTDGPDRFQVLLGARSALLLPFRDLSLIIVDEEHDPSYKQQDPAPRYHARDAALWLASRCGARVVLGSATPSIETYHHAVSGRYGLAAITQRYGGFSLPEVKVVDMREAHQLKQVHGHFSQTLLTAIDQALARHEQVILYQNRRGFSLRLECDDCHHTPQCIHCDVSLVYHKATGSLRCHYCGYSIPVPSECPACHSSHLRMVGIGTERIEEDLQIMYPDATVARMDLDTTLQKNQYLELLNDFQNRRIDILVGTQMVTKGLDFEHVSVVGVVNADNIWSYPNFRSFERAYQQLTQVSGRAGRHGRTGQVIIQTFNPQHQVLADVAAGDYRHLYDEQIQERRVFRYPPYYRLVEITLKHRDDAVLNAAATWLAAQLRATFAWRVMGPEYPLVSRVRALYLKVITLRFERTEPIADAKRVIMQMADDLTKQEGWSGISVHFDVDPC
ncbi:MAG: primosomal protein N' [Bacteroidales bacterium]|nr:primosomal protein N' [Bacteroidales bacterium]